MTLILAMPCRDGLVVCADGRSCSSDSDRFVEKTRKLFPVGKRGVFAATNAVVFRDESGRSVFDVFSHLGTVVDALPLGESKTAIDAWVEERLLRPFVQSGGVEIAHARRKLLPGDVIFQALIYFLVEGKPCRLRFPVGFKGGNEVGCDWDQTEFASVYVAGQVDVFTEAKNGAAAQFDDLRADPRMRAILAQSSRMKDTKEVIALLKWFANESRKRMRFLSSEKAAFNGSVECCAVISKDGVAWPVVHADEGVAVVTAAG